MTETHCQYCNFDEYDVLDKNDFGVILPEPNALSKGHCVIIPLRHVSSFFDITDKERKSLMSLLELARNGQQVILATHDYVLLKWFDLLMDRGKSDHVVFHRLYREEGHQAIRSESHSDYSIVGRSAISNTFAELYDEDVKRALGGD